MRVDVTKSVYQADESARRSPENPDGFTRVEWRHLKSLLRRLRYLEAKDRECEATGQDASGAAAHTRQEMEALEWLLDEVAGFLLPRTEDAA